MESVINVSIWFLPLREEMEERRNVSLSLLRDGNPAAQPLLPRRTPPSSAVLKSPQVLLMVYVIIILITTVLINA